MNATAIEFEPETGNSSNITQLLHQHRGGNREAFNAMMPMVYENLHRIAARQLSRSGRVNNTICATALVQEAYLQLVDQQGVDWQDRAHFFAICAQSMRHILVDYARRRTAIKRGGGQQGVTLDIDAIAIDNQSETIIAVHDALESLNQFNPRLSKVVECRYFGGMTEEETAVALDVSVRTVQRDWERARAWLLKVFND